MRIGVMVGPERGRYATKVDRLLRRRPVGRGRRAGLGLGPADPRRLRRADRGRARRRGHHAHRDRHRGGAGAAPPPDRARPAGAVGAGGVRRSAGARARRVAPLDHRRDARPALRAAGVDDARLPRRARPGARAAPGRSTSRTTSSACTTRSTSPTSRPTPVLLAALGPVMLAAGRRAHRRHDPLDGRRAGHRVARRRRPSRGPPRPRAGRRRASSPASRCACAATTRSTSRSPAPTASSPRPRCRRTTSSCSTTATPAGRRPPRRRAARRRSRSGCSAFADAGVTDLSIRVVPIGEDRDVQLASSRRTRELVASLASR